MDLTEAEKERSYLLYVELPNLINRIVRLSQYETQSKDFHNEVGEEIKKVVLEELELKKSKKLDTIQISSQIFLDEFLERYNEIAQDKSSKGFKI